MFFFNSLYIQRVLGYGPLKAGLAFLPFTAGIMVSAGFASNFAPRVGVRAVAVGGHGRLERRHAAADAAAGARLVRRRRPALAAPRRRSAWAAVFVPLTLIATTGLEDDDQGLASGLFNTSQQVGGALGLAILSTIAASRTNHLGGSRRVGARRRLPLRVRRDGALVLVGLVAMVAMLRAHHVEGIEAEAAPAGVVWALGLRGGGQARVLARLGVEMLEGFADVAVHRPRMRRAARHVLLPEVLRRGACMGRRPVELRCDLVVEPGRLVEPVAHVCESTTMVPEAPLEQTEHGLVPAGEGWFVLDAREARWYDRGPRGALCDFEGETEFPQVGVNLFVLGPGEPMSMYHWEADQEDFLVLSGEALLVVAGEERPLRPWDFVHLPAGVAHVLIGAGSAPAVILAVGARAASTGDDWGAYAVAEAAIRHGAGVEEETTDEDVAYARFPARQPSVYRNWLE